MRLKPFSLNRSSFGKGRSGEPGNDFCGRNQGRSQCQPLYFCLGKAIKKHKERIAGQLEELWNYTEKVAKDELQSTESIDFKEIDAEKVNQTITNINGFLRDKKVPSKVRQKLNYAKKNWANNLINRRF